jgi:hypothetical protein
MKVVINTCFGGFGLSDAAYEKLIEWGVPVRAYVEQKRDPETHLYLPEPSNEGEVIFDRDLSADKSELSQSMRRLTGRYWETWLSGNRSHPLLVRVVEELGGGHRTGASGKYSELTVVEIPDDVDYEISEYDGNEHVAEKHRTWR